MPQILFGVVIEEARCVALESLLAIERVVRGRERAARHRGDQVDLIQERMLFTVGCGDLYVAQCFEYAEGKCRRAFAAARKRDDHEQFVRIGVHARGQDRRGQWNYRLERLLASGGGAAGGECQGSAERQRSETVSEKLHAPQYTVRSGITGVGPRHVNIRSHDFHEVLRRAGFLKSEPGVQPMRVARREHDASSAASGRGAPSARASCASPGRGRGALRARRRRTGTRTWRSP